MSIPDLAAQIVNKTLNQISEDTARTIIIVGSKSVGKSSLLHSFLEKSDRPRETLVLEYSFGRKSSQKQGIEKIICHVWEYGGRLEMLRNVLVSIPVTGRFFLCIMVDLSKIKTVWNTLETCIQIVSDSYINSLPELIIIGGKYDVYKNYDGDMKKNISTTLRSMAVLYNAHLLFYTNKEPQLVRKAKEVFYNIGFGNGIPFREKNTNYTKPLMIPRGSDNWDSIGVPSSTLEQIKMRHLSRIPSEGEMKQEVKGLQRSHPEPALDSLVALKYEELHNLETFDPSIDEYLMLL
ncbi:cytoplasmic dynein 2 light intermediate chain 1 isoform X2 [Maniola jurtina]|uniref:cytoplasmic dynein 2 light intermediate chain 1 isoform X2 n=1 Tax=Maniola jurtina TaxID=191418 RepID=UPI001E68BCC1|nr:cytoplasmic dynein 2 light intermediate chain 1 isoform X2 [Maniola jurtina]